MNRFLLPLFLFCFVACSLPAQPDPLLRAQAYFAEHFPTTDFTEWAKRDNGFVVSGFDLNSYRSVEVTFNRRGQWQKTTLSLEVDQVRSNILEYIDKEFANYFLLAYEVKGKRNKHRIGLVVDTPERIYTLLFKTDGKLVERYEEGIDG